MASRPVNGAQRAVLDWLAAGGSQDPPRPEMKLSAAALAGRGLVKVRRPGGKWTAELTEAGRYYVEHGRYPGETEKVDRQPVPRARRAGHPARSGATEPDAGRGARARRRAAGTPGTGSCVTEPVAHTLQRSPLLIHGPHQPNLAAGR